MVFEITLIIVTSPWFGINSNYAQAQYFTGPQSRSLGGTGRATTSGAEGPFLNPASLAHVKQFTIAGFANFIQNDLNVSTRDLGGVFIDNNPDAVLPAAFSYLQRTGDLGRGTPRLRQDDYQLSFGRLVTSGLAAGLSVRYFKDSTDPSNSTSLWTGHWGLLFTPFENLGLGFVKYNVAPTNLAAAKSSSGFGAHYLIQDMLRLRGDLTYQDVDNPGAKVALMLGLEAVVQNTFMFRTGYKADQLNQQETMSMGLGWDGPRIGFDYAYELMTTNSSYYVHAIDLRIFF